MRRPEERGLGRQGKEWGGGNNVQEVSPPGFWALAAGARVGRRRTDTSMELRLCKFSCQMI
jgi:hypothetical protein